MAGPTVIRNGFEQLGSGEKSVSTAFLVASISVRRQCRYLLCEQSEAYNTYGPLIDSLTFFSGSQAPLQEDECKSHKVSPA